jgi:hypothetical protein
VVVRSEQDRSNGWLVALLALYKVPEQAAGRQDGILEYHPDLHAPHTCISRIAL